MPLAWSEPRDPNAECGYNHVVSETPLGQLRIEWKGWKDYPAHDCSLPWGDFIIANDLNDAKEQVQSAWNKMALEVINLMSE